jgi:thioredoxin 1
MATIQATQETFQEVIQNHKIVLVDFWAEWCPPCRVLSPILDELDAQTGDDVTIVKVNVDENPELSERFGIMSIPTMKLFREGQEAKSLVGVTPLEELKNWVYTD